MWMLFCVVSTVGYGDMYPTSLLGRSTVILISFVGVLFVGLFVFITNQSLIMDNKEKRLIANFEDTGESSPHFSGTILIPFFR